MPRPAPAVDRTVALMTFLAAHPGRSFSLSELARTLEMNKATAHATIGALTTAGWLARDPALRTYRLGPGLVAIAKAAAAAEQMALDVAREHMHHLSSEFGVRCVASAAMADEIVLLGVEGASEPLGIAAEPGHRVPMAPPMGAVFVAWADPPTVDRWLAEVATTSGPRAMERYERALALVRQRGFALGLAGHSRERIAAALSELMVGATNRRLRTTVQDLLQQLDREEEEYIVAEINRQDSYDVAILSAPVFDAGGRVVIALTLMGLGVLTGTQVERRAHRLLGATRAITAAINGHAPAAAAGS